MPIFDALSMPELVDLWQTERDSGWPLLASFELGLARRMNPATADGVISVGCFRNLSDLPAGAEANLYTHPVYLGANGVRQVLHVRRSRGRSSPGSVASGFFEQRDNQVVHLGRLRRIDEAEIYRLAAGLLNERYGDVVLFEDVHLVRGETENRLPSIGFTYQGNWRLGLEAGQASLSGNQRRQARAKARKLAAYLGAELQFSFERADEATIDRIVGLNQQKIRRAGRRHHLSASKLSALKSVCGEIGYQAVLRCGERLIAGDIVCVAGDRAYMPVLGYDLTFEKFSPGQQVHIQVVEDLQKMGCSELNLLWGDGPWKSRIGAKRDQLTTLAVARDWKTLARPRFWRACSPYASAAAKDTVKRLLNWNDVRRDARSRGQA